MSTLFGTEFDEVDGAPIALSALEFDVLWERLGLGDMPVIVGVPSPGKTEEERAELVQRAWAGLYGRGLGGPNSIDPELERLVRLLVRPDREVDGRLFAGTGVRAVAAATDGEAVLVTLVGETVTVRRIAASGLAGAVTAVLPTAPAGPGGSVTLRSEDFEASAQAGGTSKERFEDALRDRGVRGEDVATLVEMIKDVTATGNFGCARRDRLHRRRRGQRVVSFFDTADGRYAQVRRPGVDGTLWTTISPADTRRLTAHVQSMVDELTEQVEG